MKATRVKVLNSIGFCWGGVLKGDAVGSGVAPDIDALAVVAPGVSAGVSVDYCECWCPCGLLCGRYCLEANVVHTTEDVSNLSPFPPPAPLPSLVSDNEDTSCTWHTKRIQF